MKNLTPEEQNALAVRAQAGDKRAISALLEFCERDIHAIVGKAKCTKTEREDLAQVARLTILESAIPTFNPAAGLQFRFYAAQWVRTEVKRSRNLTSSVVVRNVRTRSSDLSLDIPVDEMSGETHSDLLESNEPSPEDVLIEADRDTRLRQVLEVIVEGLKADASARYDKVALCRDLLYNRILSNDPMGLDSLSKRYGIGRETVRKVECLILERTRTAILAT